MFFVVLLTKTIKNTEAYACTSCQKWMARYSLCMCVCAVCVFPFRAADIGVTDLSLKRREEFRTKYHVQGLSRRYLTMQ